MNGEVECCLFGLMSVVVQHSMRMRMRMSGDEIALEFLFFVHVGCFLSIIFALRLFLQLLASTSIAR